MNGNQDLIEITTAEIGDKYSALRIVSPRLDAAMVKSMRKYGQLTPVVCARIADGYEMIDGFKRLRASRQLNLGTVAAKVWEAAERVYKAAIIQLNQPGRSINEMEEALVLRSLHSEDRLAQVEIAVLLGRHKSWVSRRISLIERLSEEVQDDIRLGLLPVSSGRELAKLPRGNQKEAAAAVIKHRFSTREAAKLISHLLSRPRWEYQAILASPWEIVEPKQQKPTRLETRLISMERICRTVSETSFAPGEAERLSGLISVSLVSAERAAQTLRHVCGQNKCAQC
ncbi:MAG: ParB N-terminal domain-containing protein, partial [Nitrospiraceae bacterium]|nr:ParB N-terminal domain-containing protein [Nitrospiraceae bacterium]MDA8089965.1 ParB N-terminal domain-containing protein [Nitrospiraceae bacterium]